MTLHYHGTPISPRKVLEEIVREIPVSLCVSFAADQDIAFADAQAESLMLDNGAFTLWRRSRNIQRPWDAYYAWVQPYLARKTTWCVIPDVIGGTEAENDRLLCEWFYRMGSFRQAAPVWHLHESFGRLERLMRTHERVCFGSSAEYSVVGSDKWNRRLNETFNRICDGQGAPPCWIHMLRGMSQASSPYPFASVDSADVGRNHQRPQNDPISMIRRWNNLHCPSRWVRRPEQIPILQEAAS